MNTIQPEVVMPRWIKAAQHALGQHRNLSQEKSQVSLEHANWDRVHWESKKRFSPMGLEKWAFLQVKKRQQVVHAVGVQILTQMGIENSFQQDAMTAIL